MKRLVIIIALVALLVGSMIGGMVWAAAPTGKPLVMETGSGKSNTTGNLLIHSYPEVRHVSLTVYNESNGDVDVTVKIGGSDGESRPFAKQGPFDAPKMIEFDTTDWRIDSFGNDGWIVYNWSVTYPKP